MGIRDNQYKGTNEQFISGHGGMKIHTVEGMGDNEYHSRGWGNEGIEEIS